MGRIKTYDWKTIYTKINLLLVFDGRNILDASKQLITIGFQVRLKG
jgi:hypothetical protein